MPTDELKSLLTDQAVGTPSARVVRVLSERGALSATQIVTITGMAKSTVSTALSSLRKAGMVVEGPSERARGASVGRPATVVTLNPNAGTCVGLLVGVEHMELIVADVSHAVLADHTFSLDPEFTPAAAAQAASRMLDEAYRELGLSKDTLLGVGVAIAGPVNPRDGKVLRGGGMPAWAGVDVKALFEPLLQQTLVVDNESNCAAVAEMMWGAAVGCEDFVLFTVDFGVGGAIVSRGRVMTGNAGAAGEFGHMSIDPAGDLCRCGNRGCLEIYAGLRRPIAAVSRLHGRQVDVVEFIDLANRGDVGCRRLIADAAEMAGRGLGIIGSTINPGLIVVGGRLALANELFLEPLEASFDKHSMIKRSDLAADARTRIVPSRFVANAACLGAVGTVLRNQGRRV